MKVFASACSWGILAFEWTGKWNNTNCQLIGNHKKDFFSALHGGLEMECNILQDCHMVKEVDMA